MSLVLFGSLMAWVLKKPEPWVGMERCDLAQYAFDVLGNQYGYTSMAEMIEAGLYVETPVKPNELNILMVWADENGAERAKLHWLQFNPWTGRIKFDRAGDDPTRIRRLGSGLDC